MGDGTQAETGDAGGQVLSGGTANAGQVVRFGDVVHRPAPRNADASQSFQAPPGAEWSSALADPSGGPVTCRDDVCVENVVFSRGRVVGLLDLDFALDRVAAGQGAFVGMWDACGGHGWHRRKMSRLESQLDLIDAALVGRSP